MSPRTDSGGSRPYGGASKLTRYSNVQVTLQILDALIEKTPRDLHIYVTNILNIIALILRSKDLSIVEESLATFQNLCKYYNNALAADQKQIQQYNDTIAAYAHYAALKTPIQPKGGLNTSIAVQWRTVGLKALRSAITCEALQSDHGTQISIIMPVLLQNLQSGDANHLALLQQRAQTADSKEREQAIRRRMSIATVQTGDASSRPTSSSMAAGVDDADQLAEEEVAILALQGLKEIFTTKSRTQIRFATEAMLKFLCAEVPYLRPDASNRSRISQLANGSTWTTALVETVTQWTAVQDRFVILMTIVETLSRSPSTEDHLEHQLLLTSIIGCLLKSNVTIIGLSVMDVLLALVQHILLLLCLGGSGFSMLPQHQQTAAIDLFKGTENVTDNPKNSIKDKSDRPLEESTPSSNRQELLLMLQKCIGGLAYHIYYSDQVSDIIAAILNRLKPSPQSTVATAAAAIEHPQEAAQAVTGSSQLQESPNANEFFSFGTARVTALKAVKEVLTVVNQKASMASGSAFDRNRITVEVWEGTQWLLRDDDRRVRRAYVDALLTWLRFETNASDQRAASNVSKLERGAPKQDAGDGKRRTDLSRAKSNATQGKVHGFARSSFLQLLHLAIYDNAIESPEARDDILLLHLLLYKLVEKLGVNAVKTGLPMILRLQEDINTTIAISSPTAKINVACLCHGYLWILCDKFQLDTTTVGYVIQSEISRRKQHSLWIDAVQVPPLAFEKISGASALTLSAQASIADVQNESVKPFDARSDLVENIASSYANVTRSPPSTPPQSPRRNPKVPILSSKSSSEAAALEEDALPSIVKETMLSEWSKDICLAEIEKDVARSASLNGSRRGLSQRNANGHGTRIDTPPLGNNPIKASGEKEASTHPNAMSYVFQNQNRSSSVYDTGSATSLESSEPRHVVRVDELKRILAGETNANLRNASPLRNSTTRNEPTANVSSSQKTKPDRVQSFSSGSESVASVEGFESVSEIDATKAVSPVEPSVATNLVNQPQPEVPSAPVQNKSTSSSTAHSRNTSSTRPRSRPHSGYSEPATPRSLRRPSTSSSAANEDPEVNAAALRGELPRLSTDVPDEVPPVPPLPAGVAPALRPLSGGVSGPGTPQHLTNLERIERDWNRPHEDTGAKEKKRVSASSGKKRTVDVKSLLAEIDAMTDDPKRGYRAGRASQ